MGQIEDYIDVKQTAWLLGADVRTVQGMLQKKRLKGIHGKKKLLVDLRSVEVFFVKKVNAYEKAVNYFDTIKNKKEYWSMTEKNINIKSDVDGYLSVPQTAYLLNSSRQRILDMIQRNIFLTMTRTVKNTDRVLISEESIELYVHNSLCAIYDKYKNLIEYIESKDKDEYWMLHAEDIRITITEQENRRRKYFKDNYERKKRVEWENSKKN